MNFNESAALIRYYFHCDPGKLTLRRFIELSGPGVSFIRKVEGADRQAQARNFADGGDGEAPKPQTWRS